MRFRDLLPPLAETEFEALAADIKANGVRNPVCVDEDGTVLDGHHRLKIDPKAPRVVIGGLTEAEKRAFVYRSNFARRNLSPEAKREATAAMKLIAMQLREEDAKKWTQKRVAAELGVDQATVHRWLMQNMQPHKVHKPDARMKLAPEAKRRAAEEIKRGKPQAQIAANLGVSQATVSRAVQQVAKQAAEAEARKEIAAKTKGTEHVIIGDFRKVLASVPDASCALIFTDPPYHRQHLDLYRDLGKIAQRVLVEGGSLVTYLGHYLLPDVIETLEPSLKFFWPCACVHTGGTAEMREYGVKVKWKPLLWFVKGSFRRDRHTWIEDVVVSREEKGHHPWQQGVKDAKHFIEPLTVKGDLVIDPFCGSGTTALAAKELGRSYLTCDVDENAVAAALERLAE